MGIFSSFDTWIDIIIIAIPVLVAIFLIFKFVIPKSPKLGFGLAIASSLLGAFLVGRKLKNAFDVEKKIAEHNEAMAKFKEKQKNRYEAVTANKKIIETLREQRKKLAKKGEEYRTEIDLIDAELNDRIALNEQLIRDADAFLESSEEKSAERKQLLDRMVRSQSGQIVEDEPRASDTIANIEINGYRLLEV